MRVTALNGNHGLFTTKTFVKRLLSATRLPTGLALIQACLHSALLAKPNPVSPGVNLATPWITSQMHVH